MKLNKLKPRKALNKAFLKVKPNRTAIEAFKANLIQLLQRTNKTESEEFHKNLVSDFLKKTWYEPKHFINTKGRNDLVIHNGEDAKSRVGVIIEAKKPTNKSEMVTAEKLNAKAFHELMLYYLHERISLNNLEVKHLIVTNSYEWFIFDASTFDRLFAQNKTLVRQFNDFIEGRLADNRTDFFYKQIAEPFVAALESEIVFTHFDFQDYHKLLHKAESTGNPDSRSDDHKLIALFKLLSPEHLLKLPFANDSNSLDKRFYTELLHIIGLTETKAGSKKLIERNKPGERHSGSILEDAIIQLDSLGKINRLENAGSYGNTNQERLFNVALELSITWINRILFLKLLEAQLISYHRFDKRTAGQDDKSYAFLNTEKIKDYDDLNSLFFQVLAKQHGERNEDVSKAFAKVPYLNSSLFEPTEMEQQAIFISNLKDDKTIPVLASTVLKDQQGKKRTGSLNTLNYLFEFLDAYDFSSEGQEEIQEENKSLINASVLGLIFEKINGYKDGSFFTPGFITMYMSRQTIRKAVVQKFNETKNWNCHDLDELYDKIDDRHEANEIVNSLKICDPAVGSGHFLVSALNEMIAIKHDLKILQDRNGRRLKEYQVEVVNDELIVTDEEGQLFDYNPNSPESQRVQETLFHEKQSLIENCLFGVDINPNSVKICRLRLWIELLKNAYYKHENELETLPNIDINIKCGNSLVSRFDIQSDLKQALRKSKWSIASYRVAVDTYRNAQNKEQKWEMERLIADIKSNFRSEISGNDPKLKKLNKLKGELLAMTTQHQLFEMNEKEKAAWNKQLQKHTTDIQKLEAEIEAIKANKIFENAFEWRFEFPEVLNEEGDFVGFDVVIGNPPYLTGSAFKHLHEYLNSAFKTAEYQLDLYTFFIELSHNLLKSNGLISLITPNSWLKNLRMSKTRKFVLDNFNLISINPNIAKAFSEAQVDTLIFISKRCSSVSNSIDIFDFDNNFHAITKNLIEQSRFSHNESFVFDVEVDNETSHIITKIREQSSYLEEVFEITRGVNPYDKYRGQSQEIIKSRAYHSSFKKDETFLPELKGKHVSTFHYKWDNKHFISYGNWLAAPREPRFFTGIRLLFREIIGKRFVCTCIEEDFIIDRSLYIALPKDENVDVWGTLGVLCSKLLIWLFRYEKNEFDELFPKVRLEEFKKLPVPEQDKLINIGDLVKKVTQLKNENIDTDAIESQIDQLVYQLYGLTEEEIAIVEGS